MLKRHQSFSRVLVKTSKSKQRSYRRPVSRVAGTVLMTGLLVAAAYLIVIVSEFAAGVSRVEATPQVIRLQVISSGVQQPARQRLMSTLSQKLQDGAYTVEVAERQTLPARSVPQTLVVSRQPDLEPARYLAARLGLPDERVIYEPLDFNRHLIAVTLFIGDDVSFDDNPEPSVRND